MSDAEDVGIAVMTGGLALPVQAREDQKSAERREGRARAEERKIRDIKNARERRRAIREARVQRAEIEAGAQASGTTSTSGAAQGVGTVGTQLAANLSFLDEVGARATSASLFRESAARKRSQAQDKQQLFDLGVTGVKMAAGGV